MRSIHPSKFAAPGRGPHVSVGTASIAIMGTTDALIGAVESGNTGRDTVTALSFVAVLSAA